MGCSTVTSQEVRSTAGLICQKLIVEILKELEVILKELAAAAAARWTTLPQRCPPNISCFPHGCSSSSQSSSPRQSSYWSAQTQPRVDSGHSTDPHRLAAWHPLRPLCRFQNKKDRRTRAQSQHG